MKTVTIRFEFQDEFTHEEVVAFINQAIYDSTVNVEVSEDMSYTIVGRE